jgi:hypothetical protein
MRDKDVPERDVAWSLDYNYAPARADRARPTNPADAILSAKRSAPLERRPIEKPLGARDGTRLRLLRQLAALFKVGRIGTRGRKSNHANANRE